MPPVLVAPRTYAPGRGGQHAKRILQGCGGIVQVDGQARRNPLIEITCTRPAPIANEGVALIRDLYAIEADMPGGDHATRLAARQEPSAPIRARLDDGRGPDRARASAKSPPGEALAHIARYRKGLCRVLTDRRVEIDRNAIERTRGPIARNAKTALCAGHDAGAGNGAVIAADRDLQDEWHRPPRVAGGHAHRYRQRPSAKPDRSPALVEMSRQDLITTAVNMDCVQSPHFIGGSTKAEIVRLATERSPPSDHKRLLSQIVVQIVAPNAPA